MRIKLNKGLNLRIEGAAPAKVGDSVTVNRCALVPDDFPGLQARPALKEGDKVALGEAVAYDKQHPALKLVSPVAGTLKSIVRGERRKILRFEIEADGSDNVRTLEVPANPGREQALALLAESGLMAFVRTRPYDIVPEPTAVPRDIFVSCIDSAPMAVSAVALAGGDAAAKVAGGVRLLKAATEGKVYLCVDDSWPYGQVEGAEIVVFEGKHPAGNASVQIEAIAPVNKDELVWTLNFNTLCRIGHLAVTGRFDSTARVAVTGPEVKEPKVLETVIGAPVEPLLKGNLKPSGHHIRIISGNVLTGIKVDMDGYLHFPYEQISVIAEGDDKAEFLGWASLSPSKMSVSRSFPGHFLHKLFRPDARLQGGRRAMILSGQYDRTIPMDIMPEYLIKAILGRDIESMEKLGIYEVAPEDFALAEYVDASKLPLQKIVREGLDYLRKELQ